MSEVISLTVKDWLLQGWRKFVKHCWPLVGGAVIYFGYSELTSLIFKSLHFGRWIVLWLILLLVINPVLIVGWLFLCLRAVRDQEPGVFDIFRPSERFGRVWLTYFLFTLIMLGGFILLIIPGIIWGIKYGLSLFAIMDKPLKAREAIKFSGKITYGYKGKLLVAGLIIFALGYVAYPTSYVIYHIGHKINPIVLVAGIVLFPVGILIKAWTGAAWAAAYDGIVRARLASEDKPQQEKG
jgi:hypothetical protein